MHEISFLTLDLVHTVARVPRWTTQAIVVKSNITFTVALYCFLTVASVSGRTFQALIIVDVSIGRAHRLRIAVASMFGRTRDAFVHVHKFRVQTWCRIRTIAYVARKTR